MKKAILLIAALLLVGGMAFAAPSFGIWGRTVFMLAGQTANDDQIYQGWGPNWMGSGQRMGLHATFVNDKIEFKFTFYMNQTTIAPSNLYGTVKFIPDLMSLYVGQYNADGWDNFRQNTYNPNSDLDNNNIGRVDGTAIILDIAPKDSGLEIAGVLKTPAPNSGYNGWNWWPGYTIEDQLANMGIMGAYMIPDVLKIQAGFIQAPGQVVGGTGASRTRGQANVFARVYLLMVDGLKLFIDGRVYGFENADSLMESTLLGVSFKADALGIYLGAKLALPLSGQAIGLAYNANLEVTYDLGPVTAGLIAMLADGDTDVDGLDIGVRPYVNFDDFGVRLAVEIRYNTVSGQGLTWMVPVYFTLSIW